VAKERVQDGDSANKHTNTRMKQTINQTNKQRDKYNKETQQIMVEMINLLFVLRGWNRKDSAVESRGSAHLMLRTQLFTVLKMLDWGRPADILKHNRAGLHAQRPKDMPTVNPTRRRGSRRLVLRS